MSPAVSAFLAELLLWIGSLALALVLVRIAYELVCKGIFTFTLSQAEQDEIERRRLQEQASLAYTQRPRLKRVGRLFNFNPWRKS